MACSERCPIAEQSACFVSLKGPQPPSPFFPRARFRSFFVSFFQTPQNATGWPPGGTLEALRRVILEMLSLPGHPWDPPRGDWSPQKNQSALPGCPKPSKNELSSTRQLNFQFSPFSSKLLKNATGGPPRDPPGNPEGHFLKTFSPLVGPWDPFGCFWRFLIDFRSQKGTPVSWPKRTQNHNNPRNPQNMPPGVQNGSLGFQNDKKS